MQKKNMAQTENLRRWRAQKESISNTFNRNLCRIPGARRKSYLSNKEEENIINWIKENRLIKIAITTYTIILYIIKIKPDFKNKKNMSTSISLQIFEQEQIFFSKRYTFGATTSRKLF